MEPSNKPLAYSCWEYVLRRLGAELRIQLSARCPKIRTVDKNIPIRLQYIQKNYNRLKINKTIYTIGVISHYLGGFQPPPWAQRDNDNGGVPFDVGRFQDKNDYSAKHIMFKNRAPSDKETAQCFENRQLLQEALTKLSWESIHSERRLLQIKIEDLRTKIRKYNEQLAISELKFEYYVMLTIITDRVNRRELLFYNFPVEDAMEYLAEKLIGKRRIICNNFSLDGGQKMCPNNFSIENRMIGHVIEVDEREIKSIEISWCNAKFEQIRRPATVITPNLIEFKFYFPESALDDTIKAIHQMEQPRKRKNLRREDFQLTPVEDQIFPLIMESYLLCQYDFMPCLWVFRILIMQSKSEVPGLEYYMHIIGQKQ